LGQKIFASIWAKSVSQKFFFGQGPVGRRPGAKKTVICQAFLAISQDIGPKNET
jgi:hypothetical protein